MDGILHECGLLWYLILNGESDNRNLNVNRNNPDDNWNANYRAAAVAAFFVCSSPKREEFLLLTVFSSHRAFCQLQPKETKVE